MRITYIANSIMPSRSANSVHVMRMCGAFARNGHDVTLLIPRRPDTELTQTGLHDFYGVEDEFAVEKLSWPKFSGRAYIYAFHAALRARRLKSELVYSRNVHACFLSAAGGTPVIFESHAPVADFDALGAWMFGRMLRFSKFRRLVVISDALKRYYLLAYPQLAGRVLTARDGADPQAHSQSARMIDSCRLKVGYAGQLYRGKGMELIEKLSGRCAWADFHIMGGMAADIEYWKDRLKDRCNVHFHGFVPPAEVGSSIAGCDVMLAPYQKNVTGFGRRRDLSSWMSPLKIFEYMAARKAMIVSDIPVLREILNSENSILVDSENVEEWLAGLDALRVGSVRDRLANQAYDDFMRQYTWTTRAENVLK